jgi:hypothetical protein
MSAVAWVAAMAATRQLLKQNNPELLEWSRTRWATWLDRQRRSLPGAGEPSLIASASISCLADVDVHVGLMQSLTTEIEVKVMLALPTEEAARIARAQARRDEWEGLVRILNETELRRILNALPDCAAVALFRSPFIVPGKTLENALRSPDVARSNGENLLDGYAAFLGSAAACRTWSDRDAEGEGGLQSLQRIVEQDPKQLSAGNLPSGVCCERQPNAEPLNASLEPERGRIGVPTMAYGEKLVVECVDQGTEPVVLVRRYAELCPPMEQVRIRAPAKLLTTSPRRIRIECIWRDARSRSAELLFNTPPARLQSWMIAAFLNRGGGGNPVIRGFAKAVGCRIAYAEDEPAQLRDIPVVWGVLRDTDRIIAQAKAQDLYFFYIDHAYFSRGHGQSYRITRNAYEAGPIRNCPQDRISAFDVTVEPWRKSGREVLVCPPTEYFMKAHSCPDWLETTLAQLRSVTDRPIIVREKPKPGEDVVPLPEALRTAHALVTHSSNVAIEAACLGTPVFVSPSSAAAPIGRTDLADLEKPVYPDRTPWLAHLAYNQFSFEEICDGTAWRLLLQLEERELV